MTSSLIFWAFMAYSLPAWYLRYCWRSTIYRDSSWRITVDPRMGKDLYSIVSNRYFHTPAERRMAMWIRLYLAGYAGFVAAMVLR
ncbi:MAG: hypothetical protein ABI634_18920 [Acidobacteriota bacterium]